MGKVKSGTEVCTTIEVPTPGSGIGHPEQLLYRSRGRQAMSVISVQHTLKYVVKLDTGIDVRTFEYISSVGNSGTIASSFSEIPESSGGKSVDSAGLRPPF